jgi:RimJ/RimL family protein N-acetyltransferase
MAPLLDDAALHAYTGGRPATVEELRARFARQAAGRSPDGTQRWLNQVVRVSGTAVGYVQASVTGDNAELAWVIAVPHQGRGYAREATLRMVAALRAEGVRTFTAHIAPGHIASERVAAALGLVPTATVHDGETLWVGQGLSARA